MHNKQIIFNPLDSKFKSKIGAVMANESFEFRLLISRELNPDSVELCISKDGECEVLYPFTQKSDADSHYLVYSLSFCVTTAGLYFYHFNVRNDCGTHYIGAGDNLNAEFGWGNRFQLTAYTPQHSPAEWLKGGTMYQILPDRFFDGGQRLKTKTHRSDIVYRNDWGATPEYRQTATGKILNNDFFGGNLRGIIKKLPYLKSLGITCIYLNPIFEAYSNHKYDTGNYMCVDSDFGTEQDLQELIKKADKRGMRIILDGVFSHTGDDSIYFNKYGNYDSVGAYQSTDSPYIDWFLFDKHPDVYKSWWGIDVIPHANKHSKHFIEFIAGVEGVLSKWQRLGIAGWRLDVVDELPDEFLDAVAHRIKAIQHDALVLGEVWEDASNKSSYGYRRRYFAGKQLDSVSNYPFKNDIINFVNNGDGEKLANTLSTIVNNYPKDNLDSLMNLLGTHDTARILTALGEPNKDVTTREGRAKAKVKNLDIALDKLKLATALQYMLPGVPCVYYGDEVGLEGYEDPFNRRCYPWDTETQKLPKQNKQLLSYYKKLGKIRQENIDILKAGDYKLIEANKNLYVFERVKAGEHITIIANASNKKIDYAVAGGQTNLITKKPFNSTVPPYSAVILRRV